VIAFPTNDGMDVHVYPPSYANTPDQGLMFYGIVIADIVRHIAQAYEVSPDALWAAIDIERKHPTTEINEVLKVGIGRKM
jgi:hypothetical protein